MDSFLNLSLLDIFAVMFLSCGVECINELVHLNRFPFFQLPGVLLSF